MKKIILLALLVMSFGFAYTQNYITKPDTIVKLNGKRIAATVFKIDKYNVVYLNAGTKEQVKIARSEVSHVIYRTGRIQNVQGNMVSTTITKPINSKTTTAKEPHVTTVTKQKVQPKVENKITDNSSNKESKKPAASKPDSIFKRDGKTLIATVAQTTDKVIFYSIHGHKDVLSIDKKDVSKIVYNDGHVEEFAAPVKQKKVYELDTIIHISGKRILAKILKINANDVTIQMPDEDQSSSLARKEIEKLIYRGGKTEVLNQPVVQMVDDSQWESVIVTENSSDVVGLYKRGTVLANSASDARDVKSAKKSATIRLQKKAASLKANIVLVTRQEAKGGYGEVPGYEMEGTAYGFEPSAEETINAKSK